MKYIQRTILKENLESKLQLGRVSKVDELIQRTILKENLESKLQLDTDTINLKKIQRTILKENLESKLQHSVKCTTLIALFKEQYLKKI